MKQWGPRNDGTDRGPPLKMRMNAQGYSLPAYFMLEDFRCNAAK